MLDREIGATRCQILRLKCVKFDAPYPDGLTENAGRENDGPSKLQGTKLQDMKMTPGPGREIAGEKSTVLTEIILQ